MQRKRNGNAIPLQERPVHDFAYDRDAHTGKTPGPTRDVVAHDATAHGDGALVAATGYITKSCAEAAVLFRRVFERTQLLAPQQLADSTRD
jgi:hypothetical protein